MRPNGVIGFCLLFFTSAAQAEDWRLVATPSASREISFIDASTISGRDGSVKFWTTIYARRGNETERMLTQITANCQSLTYNFDQMLSYKAGVLVAHWSSQAKSAAIPFSREWDQIQASCGFTELGEHIADPGAYVSQQLSLRRKRSSPVSVRKRS